MNHIMKFRLYYAVSACALTGMGFLLYGKTDEHTFGALLIGLALGRVMAMGDDGEKSTN